VRSGIVVRNTLTATDRRDHARSRPQRSNGCEPRRGLLVLRTAVTIPVGLRPLRPHLGCLIQNARKGLWPGSSVIRDRAVATGAGSSSQTGHSPIRQPSTSTRRAPEIYDTGDIPEHRRHHHRLGRRNLGLPHQQTSHQRAYSNRHDNLLQVLRRVVRGFSNCGNYAARGILLISPHTGARTPKPTKKRSSRCEEFWH